MIVADAHCDTVLKLMELGESLNRNNCHLDISRMDSRNQYIQFFAAFVDQRKCNGHAARSAMQIIDRLYGEVQALEDSVKLCISYADILNAHTHGKLAAMLSIEGGEALEGDLSVLRLFYRLGVRSICLTWNFHNEIANGAADSSDDIGLTCFGQQVVKEMNTLGMIIDVSHISEKGFWDVLEETSKPVMASHSNAHKLCSHQRNLTDDQILAIKRNGGIIGINFYRAFLTDSGEAAVDDIVNHIEYIAGLAGVEHIGLGSDFDGDVGTPDYSKSRFLPDGLSGIQDTYKIFEKLQKLNYSQNQIDSVAGMNILRLIKKTVG